MPYFIFGLGNPGVEYVDTRHNTGRIVLDMIRKEYDGDDFVLDKRLNALVSEIVVCKEKVNLVAPETFMNNSGKSVASLVKSKKAAQSILVIYDDFQLPIGRMKISYNKSSGGHNGLESIIKSIKTEEFARLRVGTAPSDKKGQAIIPHGEQKIEKFILGKFTPAELKSLKKLSKKISEGIALFVKEGRESATNLVNQI